MKKFSIGEKVFVEMQGEKMYRRKSGKVVAVVPPRKSPDLELYPKLQANIRPADTRNHESYLVEVADPTSVQAKKVLWPRVSALIPSRP